MSDKPAFEEPSRPLLGLASPADRTSPTSLSERIRSYRDVVADWFRKRVKLSNTPRSPKKQTLSHYMGDEGCE
jgi:hypothetical protein